MDINEEKRKLRRSRLLSSTFSGYTRVVDVIGVESRGLQKKYFDRLEEIAKNIKYAENIWQNLLGTRGRVTAHQLSVIVLRNINKNIDEIDRELSSDSIITTESLIYSLGYFLNYRKVWRMRRDMLLPYLPEASRLKEDYLELGYSFYDCTCNVGCFA